MSGGFLKLYKMNTKVVIENGRMEIVLIPENGFELHVLDKIEANERNFTLSTSVESQSGLGGVTH